MGACRQDPNLMAAALQLFGRTPRQRFRAGVKPWKELMHG
jgi:hypothetical protein